MALVGAAIFWFGYNPGADKGGENSFHGHGPSAPTRSAFRTPVVWSMVLLGLINMGGFSATFFVPSAVKTTFQLERDGERVCDQHELHRRHLHQCSVRIPVRSV